MKLNSNTIKLEKESFEQLEEVVKKVASDNKIENVSGVEIEFSKDSGIVRFAIKEDSDEGSEMSGGKHEQLGDEAYEDFVSNQINQEAYRELLMSVQDEIYNGMLDASEHAKYKVEKYTSHNGIGVALSPGLLNELVNVLEILGFSEFENDQWKMSIPARFFKSPDNTYVRIMEGEDRVHALITREDFKQKF